MDGDLIKVIVVAAVLLLSWVSKGLEKKAQAQRRGTPGTRRRTKLDLLAEIERKLREAQRAAQLEPPGRPPASARPPAAPPTPSAAPSHQAEEGPPPMRSRAGAGTDVAHRHIDVQVGGLETRHLEDAVEARHLELDLTQAREGHAAILDVQTVAGGGGGPAPVTTRSPQFAPGAVLPGRLTEMQRALVWSEVLGRPIALNDASDRAAAR